MSTPSKTSNRKRSFFTKHQSTRSAVEASEPPKLPRPQRPVQPPEPPKRTDSDSEQSEDEIVDKARMKNMSKAITISSSDDSGDEALSTQLSGTEHEKPVRRHSFEDQDFTELEQAMNEIGSDEETCTIKNCLKCVMGEHGMPETVTKVMYKKKPRRKHSVPVAKSEWAIIRSRQRKRPKKRNLKFRSKFSWIDVCSGKDDCNCMKCVNPDTEWDPPDIAKKDDATSESRKEPQQQDPRPRSSSSSQKPPKKSSAGLRKPSTLPRRRRPKSKLEKQVEKDRKKKAQRLPDSPPRCHINKIRKEKSGHKIRKQRNTLLSMGLQEQRKQDSKGTEVRRHRPIII